MAVVWHRAKRFRPTQRPSNFFPIDAIGGSSDYLNTKSAACAVSVVLVMAFSVSAHVAKLIMAVQDPKQPLLEAARPILCVLVDMLGLLDQRIKLLDIAIARRAKEDEVVRRLMSIPGVGPVISTAVVALAPPAETFKRDRDFAAWLGLTPLQHSTGGKQRLGATSKMGERTLRRLLIIGASSVVRWAARKGAPAGSWLASMIARKPAMLVRVALANKMARVIWALMAKGGTYRAPIVA
jgi:transposase